MIDDLIADGHLYEDALKRSSDALTALRKMHADKTLRLLQLPAEQSDLAGIRAVAEGQAPAAEGRRPA